MKLLKNTLYIAALLSINAIDARDRGGVGLNPQTSQPQPAPAPAPAQTTTPPTLPGRGFQYYLTQVRSWPSSDVINDQGVMTSKFISLVQSSKLAPEFQTALLEAGRNLHLPLSGDDIKDAALLVTTNKNIDAVMNKINPLVIARPTPAPTFSMKEIITDVANVVKKQNKPTFTDKGIDTNWLLSVFSNLRTTILDSNTADMVASAIIENIRQFMNDYCKIAKYTHCDVFVNKTRMQVKNFIITELPKFLSDFYDDSTNLVNQDYLQYQVRTLTSTMSSGQKKAALIEKILPLMQEEWDNKGVLFTSSYKKNLRAQVIQQIEDAIKKQEQQLEETAAAIQNKAGLNAQLKNANPSYPDWYDKDTKQVDPDFLKNSASVYLQASNMNVKQAVTVALNDLLPNLRKAWTANSISATEQSIVTNKITQQIENAIDAYKNEQNNPQPDKKEKIQPDRPDLKDNVIGIIKGVKTTLLNDYFTKDGKGYKFNKDQTPNSKLLSQLLDSIITTTKQYYAEVKPDQLISIIQLNGLEKTNITNSHNWFEYIRNYINDHWNQKAQPAPDFYDENTNLIKQTDLDNKVRDAYKSDDTLATINNNLYTYYINQITSHKLWENNIQNQTDLKDQLQNQIMSTLTKIEPPYYDTKSNLFTQQSLDDEVKNLLNSTFANNAGNLIYNKYKDKFHGRWEWLSMNHKTRNTKDTELKNQINDAIKKYKKSLLNIVNQYVKNYTRDVLSIFKRAENDSKILVSLASPNTPKEPIEAIARDLRAFDFKISKNNAANIIYEGIISSLKNEDFNLDQIENNNSSELKKFIDEVLTNAFFNW